MKKESINLHGKTYYYLDYGKGTPFLFLHGWCDQSDDYIPLIQSLSKKFRVIAPDLPGFGDSKNIDKFTSKTYLDFLQEFTRELNLKNYIIAGHSFGGRIALQHANENKNIKTVILFNPAGLKMNDSMVSFVIRVLMNFIYESTYGFGQMLKITKNWYRNLFNNILRLDFRRYFLEVVFSDLNTSNFTDKRFEIIWSKNDLLFKKNYKTKLKSNLKNSKLHELSGGHFACIIKSELYAKKIFEIL